MPSSNWVLCSRIILSMATTLSMTIFLVCLLGNKTDSSHLLHIEQIPRRRSSLLQYSGRLDLDIFSLCWMFHPSSSVRAVLLCHFPLFCSLSTYQSVWNVLRFEFYLFKWCGWLQMLVRQILYNLRETSHWVHINKRRTVSCVSKFSQLISAKAPLGTVLWRREITYTDVNVIAGGGNMSIIVLLNFIVTM